MIGEAVFGTIALGATGLEKWLYSETPYLDMAIESIKIVTNLPRGSVYTPFVNVGKNVSIDTGVHYLSPSSNEFLRCQGLMRCHGLD